MTISPPKPLPVNHLVVVQCHNDFSEIIAVAAAKEGRLFADQFLHWAKAGADCERIHKGEYEKIK